MSERIALIMAGGGGTRLWPASVPHRPKQLMDPLPGRGSDGSLLSRTLRRIDTVVARERTFVVTTADQAQRILDTHPEIGSEQLIVEPVGRNTAACIALSIRVLRARLGNTADEAVLMALPADHHIEDVPLFRRLLQAASVHARAADVVVTLGIEPDHPATGFGYLERSAHPLPSVPDDGHVPVYSALRFVEKPDADRARGYVATGRYLWNAGIFVMPMGRIATELERHCASTWTALHDVESAWKAADQGAARNAVETAYAGIRPEPIDVAVMEKLTDLRVIPASVGWTDLGSWRAVYEIAKKDARGNALASSAGDPVLVDVERSLVWSEGLQVGVIGLSEVAVIATAEGVLVCPLERAQEVREIVRRLAERSR